MYADFSTIKLELHSKKGKVLNKDKVKRIKSLKLIGIERISNDENVATILENIESFIKKSSVIEHVIGDKFYRVCYDLEIKDGLSSFKELIAVEVNDLEVIPKGMMSKEIVDVKVIEFVHEGKLYDDDNCTVMNTYEMIYKYRIPAIGKVLSNELFIEAYGEGFKGPFSEHSVFSVFMSIE